MNQNDNSDSILAAYTNTMSYKILTLKLKFKIIPANSLISSISWTNL